jgi:hypothetical protein
VWFFPQRSSHGEREAGAHLRLLCLRAVGLRLCAPQTERAEHAAWHSSDGLRAALRLTPLASTVRDAVERAACSSCLGAAQVLAAPAAAMRDAGACVASSSLEAALLLAPPASAVRDAGARVAFSRLEASLLLAPPASAMRLAGARVASG